MHGRSRTHLLPAALLSAGALGVAQLAYAQCNSPVPSLRVMPESVGAILSGQELHIQARADIAAQLSRVEIRVGNVLAITVSQFPPPDVNGWIDLKRPYIVGAAAPGAIRLPPADDSRLKVTVTDSKNCSQAEEVEVRTKDPGAFAVVVGINEYPNAAAALKFARRDAEAVVTHLLANFRELKPENVSLLTDPWSGAADADPFRDMRDEATKVNITRAMGDVIRRIDSRGTFIFYYSGHGFAPTDETFIRSHYLFARDSSPLFDDGLISMDEIVDRMLRAQGEQKILILDACFSDLIARGGPTDDPARQGRGLGGGVNNRGIEGFVRDKSVYVMASSTDDELSYEIDGLDHGIFTFYLLQAVGEPPRASEPITIGKAFEYAARKVERELPLRVAGKRQRPNHWVFGRSENVIWLQRP